MLAMLGTIVHEGLFAREFLEKRTVGFEELAELLKRFLLSNSIESRRFSDPSVGGSNPSGRIS
jgi:anaerobic selenocysteine-containing dehydrogenase